MHALTPSSIARALSVQENQHAQDLAGACQRSTAFRVFQIVLGLLTGTLGALALEFLYVRAQASAKREAFLDVSGKLVAACIDAVQQTKSSVDIDLGGNVKLFLIQHGSNLEVLGTGTEALRGRSGFVYGKTLASVTAALSRDIVAQACASEASWDADLIEKCQRHLESPAENTTALAGGIVTVEHVERTPADPAAAAPASPSLTSRIETLVREELSGSVYGGIDLYAAYPEPERDMFECIERPCDAPPHYRQRRARSEIAYRIRRLAQGGERIGVIDPHTDLPTGRASISRFNEKYATDLIDSGIVIDWTRPDPAHPHHGLLQYHARFQAWHEKWKRENSTFIAKLGLGISAWESQPEISA